MQKKKWLAQAITLGLLLAVPVGAYALELEINTQNDYNKLDSNWRYANSVWSRISATNNTITVYGGALPDAQINLYGGRSGSEAVVSNKVSIMSSQETFRGNYAGGYSTDGQNATGNKITLSGITVTGTTFVEGAVAYGGGNAESNNVVINGDLIANDGVSLYVHGGSTQGTGSANDNSITINESEQGTDVKATHIYGGVASYTGTVNNNEVIIDAGVGGIVEAGSIIGGYGYSSPEVNDNTVELQSGKIITTGSGVVGGWAASRTGTANNNIIAVSGSVDVSDADLVGYINAANHSGNTLALDMSWNSASGSNVIRSLRNFDKITIGNLNVEGIYSEDKPQTLEVTVTNAYNGSNTVAALGMFYVTAETDLAVSPEDVSFAVATLNNVTLANANVDTTIAEKDHVVVNTDANNNVTSIRIHAFDVSAAANRQLKDGVTSTTIEESATVNKSILAGSYTNDEDNYNRMGDYTQDNSTTTIGTGSLAVDGSTSTNAQYIVGAYVANNEAATNGKLSMSGDLSELKNTDGFAGGFAEADGAVTGNTVTMNGVTTTAAVYGGYAKGTGDVSSNKVEMSGSNSATYIYGGYTVSTGAVSDNRVTMSGTNSANLVYGGFSSGSGEVSYNGVSITGTVTAKEVYGGFSSGSGEVSSNSVSMKNTTTDATVYGGVSTGTGDVYFNTVSVSDGSYDGTTIYGGYATGNGNVTSNGVQLSGKDGEIEGKLTVYAGDTTGSGSVVSNFIQLDSVIASGAALYGHRSTVSGTDNTLAVNGQNTVSSINNFENIIFDDVILNSNTASLTLTGTGSSLANTEISLYLDSDQELEVGDSIKLISGTVTGVIPDTATANIGIGLEAEGGLTYENNVLSFGSKLTKASEQTHMLTQSMSAGVAFLNSGADMALDSLGELAGNAKDGAEVFAAVSGSNGRFETGSHVDVDGWNAIVGVGTTKKLDKGAFTWGAFFENGTGNYSTFTGEYRGDGDLLYNGGGLLARYSRDSGLYYEASFRAGTLKNELHKSLTNFSTKTKYGYDEDSTYYGAHFGLGRVFATENGTVDAYAKYIYTHHDSESFVLDAENFDLSSTDSSRMRLGLRYTTANSDRWKVYAGAAWEYEFDGKSNGTTSGYAIEEASLKGSTIIGELGATLQASEKWQLDASLKGYGGQRDGFSGRLQVNYLF